MKLKRWTKKEDLFIKKNYNKLKYKEIGKYLGRSVNAIKMRARVSLFLKKRKARKFFLTKEKLSSLYTGEKLSINGIAKKSDVSHATVLNWLRKYGIERRKSIKVKIICKGCGKKLIFGYKRRNRKYCSNYCFSKNGDHSSLSLNHHLKDKNTAHFRKWKRNMIAGIKRKNVIPKEKFILNEDFAYCLGVYYGDGWHTKTARNYMVCLASVDKDFTDYYKKCFERWSGLKLLEYVRYYPYGRGKIYYVQKGSNDLKHFVNFDLEKFYGAPNRIKSSFLKGFVDSEGHMSFDKKSSRREIIISNNDFKLIRLVQRLLKSLGIETRRYFKRVKGEQRHYNGINFTVNKNQHNVHISAKSNLERFNELIGFSIKRKQNKLNMALASYAKSLSVPHKLQ